MDDRKSNRWALETITSKESSKLQVLTNVLSIIVAIAIASQLSLRPLKFSHLMQSDGRGAVIKNRRTDS